MRNFIETSVAKNCQGNDFGKLSNDMRDLLVDVIARVSEQSYRRGFQHGKVLEKTVDPEHFRLRASRDSSPYTDTFRPDGRWAEKSGPTLRERLFMEYPVLVDIGIYDLEARQAPAFRPGKESAKPVRASLGATDQSAAVAQEHQPCELFPIARA